MIVTGTDLLEAGWPPGPELGLALNRARELEEKGVLDRAYMLKLLRRDFPPPDPKRSLREEPAPLAEAIEAKCELDETNIGAVRRFMNQLLLSPVIERGAVMPDACPAGAATATIPVGGAIKVRNAIIPSAHSADICCSMFATFFHSDKTVPQLMDDIVASTRFGPGGRPRHEQIFHPVLDEPVWGNNFLSGLREIAAGHIADQGDGNHFAFLGKMAISPALLGQLGDNGHADLAQTLSHTTECLVLVTHHGSRGLGAHVYARGQKAARKHTDKVAKDIPDAAAWLDVTEPEGAEYWEALQYVSRWTRANHEAIHQRFIETSQSTSFAAIGNEHNFVWRRGDDFYHGKGATPAWKDEAGRPLLGLIPLNMAAPILLVLGKDNEQYLSFAPHGAGRNSSRTALLRQFRNEEDQLDTMRMKHTLASVTKGLDIRWWHDDPDLSESPIGYKPAEQVKTQIAQFGLAEVIAEIEPLGSLMAGDSGPPPWLKRKEELTWKQERAIGHRADRRKERRRLKDGDWVGDE